MSTVTLFVVLLCMAFVAMALLFGVIDMGLKELFLLLLAFAIGCAFNHKFPQVGAGVWARIPGMTPNA